MQSPIVYSQPRKNTCPLIIDWILIVLNVLAIMGGVSRLVSAIRCPNCWEINHPWIYAVLTLIVPITVVVALQILVRRTPNEQDKTVITGSGVASILASIGSIFAWAMLIKPEFKTLKYNMAGSIVGLLIFWIIVINISRNQDSGVAKSLLPYPPDY